MTRFVRFTLLAVLASSGLSAESLDDILARMDQSAKSFRTFSAKIKRTEFTKVLPNDKDETDGVRRLKRANGQTIGIVEFFGKNPETIRFAGKTVETYYPNAKRVDVYDANKFGKLSVADSVPAAVMPFDVVLGAETLLAVYVEGDFNEDALVIGAATLVDVKSALRSVGILARKWGPAPNVA